MVLGSGFGFSYPAKRVTAILLGLGFEVFKVLGFGCWVLGLGFGFRV